MADFELELELTARIDDLEKGMQDAQRAVQKSSEKMEEATKEAAESGVQPLIEKIAKVGATLFLAEAAFKVGAAAARGFAGDTESMTAALKSIPVFGPLITSVFDFGDALEYASDSAFGARAKIADLVITAKELDSTISIITGKIDAFGKVARLQGASEFAIAEANYKKEVERLEATHARKLQTIDEERMARHKALEEQDLSNEEEEKQVRRIDGDRRRLIAAEDERLHLEKLALDLTLQKLKKQEEAANLAKEVAFAAERQAELDAEAAAHHAFMVDLGERAKKKEEERLKMIETKEKERIALEKERAKIAKEEEKEREKSLKQHLELVKKISNAEQEVAKARADASKRVSQATASFSTAGGSFTTGASAELNEAKLLTKISTASKELLAEIVRNTAGIGAGLV